MAQMTTTTYLGYTMLHAASICSLDSGINWPSWPKWQLLPTLAIQCCRQPVSAVSTAASPIPSWLVTAWLITSTYLGQVGLHVPYCVCSLDGSVCHSHAYPQPIDHGNLPWSGGAACTHINLPWSGGAACTHINLPWSGGAACTHINLPWSGGAACTHINLPWSGGAACTHINLPWSGGAACTHINLPWSGGAACTHINLPWSGGAACTLAVSTRLLCLATAWLITATYLGQVALHVPMATYLDQTLLHVAHVCSLDSSVHWTLVSSHSLTNHSNPTWSGGAECTHSSLPWPHSGKCTVAVSAV